MKSLSTTIEPADGSTRGRALAWLRLLAYVGVLSAASAWWLGEHAEAALSETALLVGRELSAAQRTHRGTTDMLLNGQPLALNSATTSASVREVLDRFSELCAQASGGAHAEIASLLAKAGDKVPRDLRASKLGLLREEPSADEGTAACFARAGTAGVRGLLTDLELALESGDLSALGQFRYVFAHTSKTNGATHVISIWSRGGLKLSQMFPLEGDVPGSDLFEHVRPPQSKRLISARAENAFHDLLLYESKVPAAQVLESYDRDLKQLGYEALLSKELSGMSPVPVRVYQKPNEQHLMVHAREHEGRTLISAFRLATTDYARASF